MKPSRTIAVVVACLATAVLVLTGCTGSKSHSANGGYHFTSATKVGTTIPVADRKKAGDFSGDLLDGGKVSLAQFVGKVTVLNFWGTWCPPCVVETPQFDSVYRSYKAKDVAFLGIDTKDLASKAKAFVADNNISYPIMSDQAGRTGIELGDISPPGLPFTVVLDKTGKVAGVYFAKLAPADLTPVLNTLIAES